MEGRAPSHLHPFLKTRFEDVAMDLATLQVGSEHTLPPEKVSAASSMCHTSHTLNAMQDKLLTDVHSGSSLHCNLSSINGVAAGFGCDAHQHNSRHRAGQRSAHGLLTCATPPGDCARWRLRLCHKLCLLRWWDSLSCRTDLRLFVEFSGVIPEDIQMPFQGNVVHSKTPVCVTKAVGCRGRCGRFEQRGALQ